MPIRRSAQTTIGFPAYIWSHCNIFGCILGSVALWLHFGGIVVDQWPWLVLAFYGLGWLIGRRAFAEEIVVDFRKKSDGTSLLGSLDQFIGVVESRLPTEAVSLLSNIRSNLAELLPRMAECASYPEDTYIIEAAIRRYIPSTLASYLKLPKHYAQSHNLAGGKTASALLIEQLGLLDKHIQKLLKNALDKDAMGLLENGRFLADKFKADNVFKLGDDP